MFTYIKTKNFKSLIDFKADFRRNKKTPQKRIIIYGENGVGKSNFIDVFRTLSELLETKYSMRDIEQFLKKLHEEDDESIKLDILKKFSYFKNMTSSAEKIISGIKTVGTTDNIVLEFGFRLKRKDAYYRIEMDGTNIVSEKLAFLTDAEEDVLFDLSQNKAFFHKKIFKTETYKKEVLTLVEQFFGKHSFLAIIRDEISIKMTKYIKQNLSKDLLDILYFLRKISLKGHTSYGEKTELFIERNLFRDIRNLSHGEIDIDSEHSLNKLELFLDEFFQKTYSDIKKVYYKREYDGDNIKYNLYVKKKMYNEIFDIDFREESTGTKNILTLIPFFISILDGNIVLIDEVDSGIHDLLVSHLLENLPNTTGQFFITTHNTKLLETELSKDAYILSSDSEGRKHLVSLVELENGRIHKNINPRKRYLEEMYGGVPSPQDLDYDSLLATLE